jgi:hypothetical protein
MNVWYSSIIKKCDNVGFEVLTAVIMKSTDFCDITPCSPLKVNRLFGGTYRRHFHGRISRERYQRESRFACFLKFFRKVGWLSTDYMAIYCRICILKNFFFLKSTYQLPYDGLIREVLSTVYKIRDSRINSEWEWARKPWRWRWWWWWWS